MPYFVLINRLFCLRRILKPACFKTVSSYPYLVLLLTLVASVLVPNTHDNFHGIRPKVASGGVPSSATCVLFHTHRSLAGSVKCKPVAWCREKGLGLL
jgi:hypothetical protein